MRTLRAIITTGREIVSGTFNYRVIMILHDHMTGPDCTRKGCRQSKGNDQKQANHGDE